MALGFCAQPSRTDERAEKDTANTMQYKRILYIHKYNVFKPKKNKENKFEKRTNSGKLYDDAASVIGVMETTE